MSQAIIEADITLETCDRHPSSKAQVMIQTPAGPLALCGHCAREHEEALKAFPEIARRS